MSATNRSPKPSDFVEAVGSLLEDLGSPRMAGRILGWLMVCEPELQTAAEIGEALRASKGSVSTMTRQLLQSGAIERVRRPGERAACFRCARRDPSELFRRKIALFDRLARTSRQGLELLAAAPPDRREPLCRLHEFHLFLQQEATGVLERWERQSTGSRK
jgi:DNA-binding transcriptional regulator GbsR (MarR family)